MSPKISIIIPMYNVEKYLQRCLDSVQNQTFADFQAICVDDGSSDKSGEIAEEYAARDKRFLVVHKKNGGQSDARNFGTELAKGEFVLYLDSDDFIHPQTLEILYQSAVDNNADMVVFKFDINARKQMEQMLRSGLDVSSFLPKSYNKKYDIKKIPYVVTNNVLRYATERGHALGRFTVKKCYPVLKMLRREIACAHKFITGIVIEDFPWWVDIMFARPRTVILDVPLYFYVPNVGSSLHTAKVMFIVECICTGLKQAYSVCSNFATKKEARRFNAEFLWPFIITIKRSAGIIENKKDIARIKNMFIEMRDLGILEKPVRMRAKKYKRRIEKFISE
ncbi:MAG: glycosyltransferase family 2 protein [Alphaproteobacteria bacterium]|nr:glycosyltransferase family 2 protein [Alphaproteobacteria bacterium]